MATGSIGRTAAGRGAMGRSRNGRFSARHADDSLASDRFARQPDERMWSDYHQKGRSKEMRNILIERYLPLVRYNAERIYARLPDEVDLEDLISAGLFGLMDAIDAFEPERNVKFETYCAPRIRGAILDELRAMDWVPRLVRHRTAKVEQARQKIEMEQGRRATEDEIATRLGVEGEEFEKIRRDSSAVMTISITRKVNAGSDSRDELREIEVVREDGVGNPLRAMQRKDLRNMITKGLSRSERLIMILYYFENMTMKEIGATLDLSESRVSQMHSSIIARLRSQMQHRARELEPVD